MQAFYDTIKHVKNTHTLMSLKSVLVFYIVGIFD